MPLCILFRWFWISWKDGLIAFGKGIEAGMDEVLFWQDVDSGHEVQSIGISTGMGNPGLFEFMSIQGTSFLTQFIPICR